MSTKSHKILATFGQLTTDLDNAKVLLNKMGRKVYRKQEDSKLTGDYNTIVDSVNRLMRRRDTALKNLIKYAQGLPTGV
jgi:hypothetical protein